MYLVGLILIIILFKRLKLNQIQKLIGFLSLFTLLMAIFFFNKYKNGVYKLHKDTNTN